jgi:hypothetical protein
VPPPIPAGFVFVELVGSTCLAVLLGWDIFSWSGAALLAGVVSATFTFCDEVTLSSESFGDT